MKQFGFGDIDKFGGQLVRLANWTNGGNNDFGVRGAAPRENPNWSVTPNLIWLKGNHNIKTGFSYIEARRIQLNTFQRYNFSDEQTRGLAAGRTRPAYRSPRPCWVCPMIFKPNCRSSTEDRSNSSTPPWRPTCRTNGSCRRP